MHEESRTHVEDVVVLHRRACGRATKDGEANEPQRPRLTSVGDSGADDVRAEVIEHANSNAGRRLGSSYGNGLVEELIVVVATLKGRVGRGELQIRRATAGVHERAGVEELSSCDARGGAEDVGDV